MSTFTVKDGMGIFNGTVAIVPKLKAPGFCNAQTDLLQGKPLHLHVAKFNDASAFTHLVLTVRTTTPSYKGYKVSFAADTLNPQFRSFKANFVVPKGSEWQRVAIPFDKFSKDWSAFTGDCDTVDPPRGGSRKHVCCTPETSDVCPTPSNLKHIMQVGIWTEGHAGDFHLEIKSVGAGRAHVSDDPGLASF